MHTHMPPLAAPEEDKLLFELTRWDLIQLARDEDPADYARRQSARALNQLCEIYRAPVLAYLARRTVTPQDAEDLAQEFFTQRICPNWLGNAAAHKGRFRALLLVSLKNFVRDQVARDRAEKRGGKVKFVPLQEADGSCSDTAGADDVCFDACWAKTVVDRALTQLRRTFSTRGGAKAFDGLVPFIGDPAAGAQVDDAARRLGITVNALHVRISRLRALYAKCVRDELARTVASPDEIEPEIRYLLDVLAASN
jgi:RNA polymerase sigma-70 factor (ECF subfamily)